MNNGILIPAPVVRAATAALAVALIATAVATAPEVRRYLKLKSM